MTKFNPEGKDALTYGECLEPAMGIVDQTDADQYLVDYVVFIQKALDKEPRKDSESAEGIAKANLGYFAGYYNSETMSRVNRLFHCMHPIFGNVVPTPQEAFKLGQEMASKPRG